MFLLVNDQADDTGNRSGWDGMFSALISNSTPEEIN